MRTLGSEPDRDQLQRAKFDQPAGSGKLPALAVDVTDQITERRLVDMSAKRHEPPLFFVSLPIRKSAILLLGLSLGLAFASQAAAAQTFSVLYSFNGGGDGRLPVSPVILDGAGNVYGPAGGGGLGPDTGTVFELNSPCPENTLYRFPGTPDSTIPHARLFPDATRDLYGTTRWAA